MPMPLMIVYRVLGILFLALAVVTLWEKYRTVRGATLLPGRILACRKAERTNPRQGAGGYRYLVEIHAGGERLELETNDSFWFNHDSQKGKSVLVWYNPQRPVLERKSLETELLALAIGAAGVALLLIH
ncbi:DUF3592 domain-containing protein [Subdoligranulum variabile]|uniref:DUF3592 domain-containing protein n=1 Tax=Subdoligranulum variabile DSM 15176 TaxID=411471 RepID=D1PNL7_9FIRM|nr:DUF3592 domain-containing protein [Subdoligranulum variabile]EFB76153.1 hypothetical protein SUBVAR_05939 [Subdoligranulum variabile DSM 15176]UWP68796.1 DUF3592 domain-containing protein [Subdoligranulum variabile]